MISARTPKPAGETPALSSVSSVFSCESSKLKFRGAQPPRLLLGAPSRRTLMWRAYCFDPHPRTAMPTTRASSAAPEAGALPNPLEQGANRENRGAQPPRLLFGAPSRRTFVWRAYCFDLHPRTAMPTTRASSAAPEAGALPIPTESQRSILVQNVPGYPRTGRVCLDEIPADGVNLAAHCG